MSIVICAMLLVGIGCQPKPRKSFLDRAEATSGKKLRTTPQQLRLKIHHAALPLSGIIEASADQILADTTDPTVRKNVLLWKINGIPAIQQAAFQSDPFLGFLDLWVLSVQMRLFFEEGAGKNALGRWHTIAAAGAHKVESIIKTLAREISSDGDISVGEWGTLLTNCTNTDFVFGRLMCKVFFFPSPFLWPAEP